MCKKRTYNMFAASLYAIFGLVLITLSVTFKEFGSNETAYLNQIAKDWETVPLVNL